MVEWNGASGETMGLTSSKEGMCVSRRDAVLVAAGTCVASVGATAEQGVTLARFLALSRALTGAARLDTAMGGAILGGLLARGHAAGIARLADDPGSDADRQLANDITAAWYSGVFNDADGTTRADLNAALLWDALTFTKPWGTCGGETGYWRNPPDA